jgi:lipopolysaccharide export LptBFGC system permease protein LptF
MEFLFIVFYTIILGLVAPYVKVGSDRYGSLIPPMIALATGAVLWVLLTWFGFSYFDGYIWSIVMITMPIAMFFGSKILEKKREQQDNQALAATR